MPKLFIVTMEGCGGCRDFKKKKAAYEEIWEAHGYSVSKGNVFLIHSNHGQLNLKGYSDSIRSLINWTPCVILVDSKEYERSKGIGGYRYKKARIYGTTYTPGKTIKSPSVPLSVKGFEEFLSR